MPKPKPKDVDLVHIILDPELKRRLKKGLKMTRDVYLRAVKYAPEPKRTMARKLYEHYKRLYDYFIAPNVD